MVSCSAAATLMHTQTASCTAALAWGCLAAWAGQRQSCHLCRQHGPCTPAGLQRLHEEWHKALLQSRCDQLHHVNMRACVHNMPWWATQAASMTTWADSLEHSSRLSLCRAKLCGRLPAGCALLTACRAAGRSWSPSSSLGTLGPFGRSLARLELSRRCLWSAERAATCHATVQSGLDHWQIDRGCAACLSSSLAGRVWLALAPRALLHCLQQT